MTKSDPGTPDPDSGANQDDAVWLDLVARLEQTDSGLAPEASSDKDAEGTAQPPAARTFRDFDPLGLAAAGPATTGGPEEPGTADGPRDYKGGDEDGEDGAFIPEEPPSLSDADPLTVLAWLGAVGGPIALLLSAMFWRAAPLLAIVGMVAAFAISVVFLITKLPGEKDEYDDGARV